MKFLVLSTDEQTFQEHIVTQFPVVGTSSRFVVPADCFFDDLTAPVELYIEELAELGINFDQLV